MRALIQVIRQRAWLLTCCLALGVAPLTVVSVNAQDSAKSAWPKSVLFMGNSFTHYNGGLAVHFKALAASTKTPRDLVTEQLAMDGATLADLRQNAAIMRSMRTGAHDLVVLQDDLPEYTGGNVEPFHEHVRWFNQEIRVRDARTVLFMAWGYERLNWVSLTAIAEAHRLIGAELGIPVAPVGLAFEASKSERPQMAMLAEDREHQSLQGTYLAACVLYAVIFRESPEGASYTPSGMSPNDAVFLQRVAWQTVLAWNAGFTAQ